jgi:hypothetical protein
MRMWCGWREVVLRISDGMLYPYGWFLLPITTPISLLPIPIWVCIGR